MLFAASRRRRSSILVGATYRECAPIERPLPPSVRDALVSLSRNRAFVTLSAAMMAMIVAITVLNKSVLYYFKYLLNDPEAGQLALASMGIVSAHRDPAVDAARARAGAACALVARGAAGDRRAARCSRRRTSINSGLMQIFLIAMQVMIVGLNFVFWAMLPNTIEYGEQATGAARRRHGVRGRRAPAAHRDRHRDGDPRLELRDAPAIVANVQQSAETLAGMRAPIVIVPVAVPGPVVRRDAAQPARTRSHGASELQSRNRL